MSLHTRARHAVLAVAAAAFATASVSPVFAQGPAATAPQQQLDPERVGPMIQATIGNRFGSDLVVGDRVVYSAMQQTGQKVTMTLEVTDREADVISIVEEAPGEGQAVLNINLKTGELIAAKLISTDGEEIPITLTSDEEMKPVKDSLSQMASGQMPFSIPAWTIAEAAETVAVGGDSLSCNAVVPDLTDPTLAQLPAMQKEQMASMLKIYSHNDVPRLIPFPVAMMSLAMPEALATLEGGLVKTMGMELVEFTRGER